MEYIHLTRRNLQSLINKLDRNRKAEEKGLNPPSACTLIKYDWLHPVYPNTCQVTIEAIEDEDYYADRAPGEVHEEDEP